MSPGFVTLVNAFEVPAGDDEPFIAAWQRARDFLETSAGFGATALHRALRDDVELRFVEVARVDSPESCQRAVGDPGFPGRELAFTSHSGVYETVREDRTPDVDGGVVLINPFEIPPEEDERFLSGWDSARATLAEQRGYLGTRLHRSLGPADFRFVDIASWSSPLMFARALQRPEFQQAAAAMPFRSHPALYL